jgi:hypothetical protein
MFRARDGGSYYEITYGTKPEPEPEGNPDPIAKTYANMTHEKVAAPVIVKTPEPVSDLYSAFNLIMR